MATWNNKPVDFEAAADLTTKLGAFCKNSATGVVACSVLGERADGILLNAPKLGKAASLQMEGSVLVKVGAVPVAANAELTTDANGFAITAVATNIVRAKATEAGAAGAENPRDVGRRVREAVTLVSSPLSRLPL